MRRLLVITGLVLGALALVPAAGAEAAEKLPEPVIAVLDSQRVLRDSKAGRDIRRQIDAYRKAYQAEIKAEEAKLRQIEDKLKRQRAVLAPDIFEKRRREFEQRVISLQRRVQDRTRALDRAFDSAMRELRKPLIPLVRDLTRRSGYNLVVDNSQVLMALKGRDITESVIAQLDKRISSMKVPEPTIAK
ncbi:MAG: OmpH family outer membrane protein [Alphaproteobacteria bacterium]|jgi:Skp family chaperone for outer membrane proteins|nr:OmpH family outer membrane protein [Alphaproteobacteria bacterium]